MDCLSSNSLLLGRDSREGFDEQFDGRKGNLFGQTIEGERSMNSITVVSRRMGLKQPTNWSDIEVGDVPLMNSEIGFVLRERCFDRVAKSGK